MDFSEILLCIKCDGDKNLLACSENDCHLAIHKECMGCPARLDFAGHFYCPYCWYKKAVAEIHQARDYTLSRKKALLIFMDEGVTCRGKHLGENRIPEEKHETNAASTDHDALVMAHEQEDSLQEAYENLSASASEEPSQTVPARGKRGLKRSGPVKTIKPKVKLSKPSGENMRTSSTVTPLRRS